MSFEGMDADQLRGLAAQINRDAQALSGLVTTMTGVVARLSHFWHGPVAVTFEQDWQTRYRPALLAACGTLTDLHAHLVSNIDQQASASAADGGWAERLADDASKALTVAGLVGIPVTLISELASNAHDVNSFKGTSLWSKLTDDHLFSLSPHDIGWVNSTSQFLDKTHLDTGFKVLGVIGTGVSLIHFGQDAYAGGQDLSDGNYGGAANEFALGVSDGLKAYPSPVAYLAGVDVKLLDEVANLDWKNTPSPFSGDNFQEYYWPQVKSMGTGAYWEQAFNTLWGAMG
jgi:uncharacterized protein YukE